MVILDCNVDNSGDVGNEEETDEDDDDDHHHYYSHRLLKCFGTVKCQNKTKLLGR